MASTDKPCASPDLFADFGEFEDDANANLVVDHKTNDPVRQFREPKFSCTGKLEDPRRCLSENVEFFRAELNDSDVKCVSPPNFSNARRSFDSLYLGSFKLDQLSLSREEDVESIFNFLRMTLYELECKCGGSEQRVLFIAQTKRNETEDLRRQLSLLLAFLEESLSTFCQDITSSSKEVVKNVMIELKSTLLQIGRVHEIPQGGFVQEKGGNPYFHACLDVWYTSLKIFLLVQRSWLDNAPCVRLVDYSTNQLDDVLRYSTIEQMVDVLLSDLIALAALRFNDELFLSDDCWCFQCPCLLKLWRLLQIFCNVVSKQTGGEDFWRRFDKSVRRTFSSDDGNVPKAKYADRFSIPSHLRKTFDSSLFFWRFLRSLSCLYQANKEIGHPAASDLRPLFDFLVSNTILPVLGNGRIGTDFSHSLQVESRLRLLLSQYLTVYAAFEANALSLLPRELWNYFQKRLGVNFCSQDISELLTVYDSAFEWLEKIRRLGKTASCDVSSDRRSSYELFLTIMVSHCISEDSEMRLWTQLKGRILSRWTPKRFSEFSECALFNCLRLFLTVAQFIELEIVHDYVLEFLSEIPLQCSSGGVSKQKIVWQALSVTLLLYQERPCAATKMALKVCQHLASSVNGVYQAYTRTKNDVVVRRNLWELLSYSFKLLQELSRGVKSKDDLSVLLPIWTMDFYQIFVDAKECGDVCGQHRIDFLAAVVEILERLRDVNEWQQSTSDERSKWHTIVKERLLRTVRLHVHCWPWSNELADAWFKFIALGASRLDFSISAVALFNEFINVSTPNFDSDILCGFLARLADSRDVLRSISGANEEQTRMEEAVGMVSKAWLRCVFTSPQSSQSVSSIARFITESTPWRELLDNYRASCENGQMSIYNGSDHTQIFKTMCSAVEHRYNTTPMERAKLALFCQRTFTVPVRKLVKILTNAEPMDVYFHCTQLLALLVERCAPSIHHRDPAESLLREIIGSTICNPGVEKTPVLVKQRRLQMAAECLLPMLKGLLKCDWNQNEAVRKQLLECYRVELLRLAHDRKIAIIDSSPLVIVLRETFSSNLMSACPLENLRLLLMKDMIVTVTARYPSDKQLARTSLAFVRCVVEKTRSLTLICSEADEILCLCLSAWLLHDDRSLISDCTEVIDFIQKKVEMQRSLGNLITVSLSKILTERWQVYGWRRILGLASQIVKRYPNAKLDVVECIERTTEDIKRLSGSAEDIKLTAALHYFAAEMSIL